MALNLALDPQIADFLRRREAKAFVDSSLAPQMPEEVPEPVQIEPAPPAPVAPAGPDPIAELQALDDKERANQGKSYLGAMLSDSGALIRGRQAPFRSPPQVDDSIRKFIISRKLGGAAGDADKAPPSPQDIQRAIAAGVPEKVARNAITRGSLVGLYGKYGEPQDPEKVKPTLEQHAAYVARGAALKRPVLPVAGEPPKDFAKRVEAQEEAELGTVAGKGKAHDEGAIKLRQEFQGLKPVQEAEQVASAYETIKTTSESAAGDVSLVFAYMKLVDPSSSVRETEAATVYNAGNVPEQVRGQWNRLISGEKLDPNVRRNFKKEAESLFKSKMRRYEAKAEQYRRLAKKSGYDPDDIVLPFGDVLAGGVDSVTGDGTPDRFNKYVPKGP